MLRFTLLLIPLFLALDSPKTTQYTVRYHLGQMDVRVASVDITWEEASLDEIPTYHSVAILRTTPFFKLFLRNDYTAETYFHRENISPLYFAHHYKNGMDEYLYHQDIGEIEFNEQKRAHEPRSLSIPYDDRTMDLLSLVHFMRFLNLSALKQPMPMKVLMSGIPYPAEISFLEEDLEKFPGQPAHKFLIRMTEHGLMENGSGNEIYLWRSMAPDHTLLGLETRLSTGSMSVGITPPKEAEDEN